MTRSGKWAAGVAAGVAVVAGGGAIAGYLLPANITTSSSVFIAKSRQEVWNVLADHQRLPSWSPEFQSVRILRESPPLQWEAKGSDGTTFAFEDVVRNAPSELVSRISSGNRAFSGTWTLRIAEAQGGSTVAVTSDTQIQNPYYRVLGHLFLARDKDRQSLEKLKQMLEKGA
jgi:uncharacterized membrane protein